MTETPHMQLLLSDGADDWNTYTNISTVWLRSNVSVVKLVCLFIAMFTGNKTFHFYRSHNNHHCITTIIIGEMNMTWCDNLGLTLHFEINNKNIFIHFRDKWVTNFESVFWRFLKVALSTVWFCEPVCPYKSQKL